MSDTPDTTPTAPAVGSGPRVGSRCRVKKLNGRGYWWVRVASLSVCGTYVKVEAGPAFGRPRWVSVKDIKTGREPKSARQSCCSEELARTVKPGSGCNSDGDQWQCPACGKNWVYVDDEAEGGSWFRGIVHGSPNAR